MIQPYVVIVSDPRGVIRRKMHVLAESPGDANHWGYDWFNNWFRGEPISSELVC